MQAVKMYTTAVCPYCIRAKQILKSKGVEQIEEIRIDTDPAARDVMMQSTGRRTDRCRCRSEEHTSELQSQSNLVCRLLLEKKKAKRSLEPPQLPRGPN